MSDERGASVQSDDSTTTAACCSAAVSVEDADWLAAHLRAMIMSRPAAWARAELTLPQLTALHYISAAGPVTLGGLSDALGTGPPATCAMVDRLTRAGLVTRQPDPHDRRRVQLMVSDEAGPMIGRIDLDTARRLHAVLNCMTPAAKRYLTNALRQAAQSLTRTGEPDELARTPSGDEAAEPDAARFRG